MAPWSGGTGVNNPGARCDCALVLESNHCIWLPGVAGGGISADVVTERGQYRHPLKQIGSPNYQPYLLDFPFPVDPVVLSFIVDTWKGRSPRLTGSIVACGFDRIPLTAHNFANAFLEDTVIPYVQVDDASHGLLRLKLVPETLTIVRRTGIKRPEELSIAREPFVNRHYQLELNGLDCTDVLSVDSFTVHQAIHSHPVGELLGVQELAAGNLTFPNLSLSLANNERADGWFEWFDTFVVKSSGEGRHLKKGKLTLLSADMRRPIAHVTLDGVGICAIREDYVEAQRLAPLRVELYCDRMEFGSP